MCAVEWKKLGDVCYFQNGFAFKSNKFKEEGLGIVRITNIKDSVLDLSSLIYFERSDYPNQDLKQFEIHKGDILIAMSGATTGKIGCFLSDETLYLNQRVGKFIPCEELDNRYLYHLLKKDEEFFYQLAGGGAQPNLSSIKLMDSYCFYLPTLAKQQEIVSHLDTFTTLISNLESELDMRRKQYEHYRNQLLDFEGKDSRYIVPFGDICKIVRGNGVQKADFVEVGIGCIHYGQIYTHYGSYTYTTNRFVSQDVFDKAVKASKGDIIMTDTSENVEDICKSVAYLGDEDIAVSNHSFIIKHNQNPKYLSFCTLTYSFGLQKKKVVFGAKVSSIKQDNLAKINIYLPPIEEQNQIVEKLDAFENLIQSLDQEIKLRQKQYEYYREKLLTFEKE